MKKVIETMTISELLEMMDDKTYTKTVDETLGYILNQAFFYYDDINVFYAAADAVCLAGIIIKANNVEESTVEEILHKIWVLAVDVLCENREAPLS